MESKAKKILWLLYPAVMGLIWYTQLPRILLMTGTTAMQYFVISLVSVLSIAILNLLRFRLPDFLLLFTVIFMVVSKPDFVEGFSDFLIFFLIFGIGYYRKELQKGKVLFSWITFILYVANRVFLRNIYDSFKGFYFRYANGLETEYLVKAGIFILLSAAVVLLDTLLILLIRKIFGRYLVKISVLEKSYPKIARNFILCTVCLFVLALVFQYQLSMFMTLF